MTDFTIKADDTSPALKYQLLTASRDPVDLSGANEVRFLMGDVVAADTNSGVTITDAANGKVKYEWQTGDTSEAGHYDAEWEVEYSDGTVETFPNTGFIAIRVRPDLN